MAPSDFVVQDGVILWYDGPEWDDVAAEVFEQATTTVRDTAAFNAPWEDRTGDARDGLEATSETAGGLVSLFLFHTVEYGLWLEVIQNGRFATIMPTLEQSAPAIFDAAAVQVRSARQGKNYV